MEPEEIENIQNELSTKICLPKEEKNKIYGKIFYNLLLALGVLIYFIFLNLGYLKLEDNVFKNDLKVFAIILLGFTIYFIEKAYKTDRGTYLVHSIELLVLSIITLYMPYVYFYHNTVAQFLFTTSSVYLAIYYTIKSICIYIIYKHRYIHKISDVSEIIKEDEPDYLDEESKKILEEKVKIAKNEKKIKEEDNKKSKKERKLKKSDSKNENEEVNINDDTKKENKVKKEEKTNNTEK
ncbi:MAG: hypothetical protein HFJ43_05550 [Clostridia bacterium]|nr:hypothetical protein [Clostridia bacterium]